MLQDLVERERRLNVSEPNAILLLRCLKSALHAAFIRFEQAS